MSLLETPQEEAERLALEKIMGKRTSLSFQELEKLAIEFANDITPIKDITCPREVRNPGLYFGFMKAVKLIVGDK